MTRNTRIFAAANDVRPTLRIRRCNWQEFIGGENNSSAYSSVQQNGYMLEWNDTAGTTNVLGTHPIRHTGSVNPNNIGDGGRSAKFCYDCCRWFHSAICSDFRNKFNRCFVAKLERDVTGGFGYERFMLSDWLHKALKASRISQAEAARQLTEALGRSIDRAAVNKMVKGSRGIAADELVQLELITGIPHNTQTVPIVGRAGAGPDGEVIFDTDQQELDRVPAPINATETTVGLETFGDSMRGIANDGWLIFYDDRHYPPSEDMIGELCVVGTGSGRTLVKFLAPGRGSGLYDLESVNAPTMRDEPIIWAAFVTSIVPRRSARKLLKANVNINSLKTASY